MLTLLLLLGCVRTVHVVSDPVGAELSRRGAPSATAPMDVRVRWLAPVRVTARMAGYRPLKATLRAQPLRRETTVELRLERERPPLQ